MLDLTKLCYLKVFRGSRFDLTSPGDTSCSVNIQLAKVILSKNETGA